MNKKTKKFAVLAVILCMVVFFAGCGNPDTTDTAGSGSLREKINITDISWNVDEGIVGGDRYVLLNFTNNTKYTITGLKITFKEKTDITEEEKETFYSDLRQNFEVSDEDMETLKSRPISMHTETDRVVDAGESVSNINCYYYSGSYYLKDINHYHLVEPDIATIEYIDDDRIFTEYYDYSSKKYSVESESEIAYQWSQTDLGSKIPKPDVKVLESDRDKDSIFMFDAYGMSLEQFNAYVGECKELGYTVDPGSYEGFYSADNAEGYNVYLYYTEKDASMSGTVSAPETKSE